MRRIDAETIVRLAAAISISIPDEDVNQVVNVVNGQLERVDAWESSGLFGVMPALVFDAEWS